MLHKCIKAIKKRSKKGTKYPFGACFWSVFCIFSFIFKGYSPKSIKKGSLCREPWIQFYTRGNSTFIIFSIMNLSGKWVYTLPTNLVAESPIQISTISGRTYCWQVVAKVCRKQYAVFPARSSFIISFIFNRCKSVVKGLSQSINPCACVGMGIFLYSILPFLRLRLRAIKNSPSRCVSSSISQGRKPKK